MSSHFISWPNAGGDTYWCLPQAKLYNCSQLELLPHVAAAGYVAPKFATKERLGELLQRDACGMLCYEAIPVTELETFCVDRKLVKAHQNPTKRWLVERLLEADKNPKFEKFLELPPEVCKKIIICYVRDFPNPLSRAYQPPLAKVCRELRQKTLPIFYETCSFTVKYYCDPEHTLNVGPSVFCMRYFYRLGEQNLGNIRHLRVKFYTARLPPHVRGPTECYELDLDLGSGNSTPKSVPNEDLVSLPASILAPVLQQIKDRPNGKLRLIDFNKIRIALERRLNER